MEKLKELKTKSMGLEPVVRIGKSGLTESVVSEIKKHLKKKKLIKIKMLQAFVNGKDKKVLAKEIADTVEGVLIHTVGFVVVVGEK